MCNARPCVERRARAQAAALKLNPQVANVNTPKPTVKTQKTTVKSPITHVTKRGK